MNINIIIVILYFLICIFVAWVSNRKKAKTFDSYILADRRYTWPILGITIIGTWIGGGTLIGFTGKLSTTGLAFLFVSFGVFIGFILLGIMSDKYRARITSGEADSKTIVERLSNMYGKNIKMPLFIIISIIMILFVAVQIYAGAKLIGYKLNIEPILAILLCGVFTAIYTMIGGTRGDVITDIIQVSIIIFALLFGLIYLLPKVNIGEIVQGVKSVDPEFTNILRLGMFFLVGSIILPTFSIHTDAGIQQKLIIAKSNSDAKKGAIFAAVIYFIFFIILFVLVFYGISDGRNVVADETIFHIADKLPIPFLLLFSLAVLSAVLSTVDSELLLISALFVNDILIPISKKRNIDIKDKSQYLIAKTWVILTLIAAMSLAMIFGELFDIISSLWVLSLSALGIPIIGLSWKWIGKKLNSRIINFQIILSVVVVGLTIWLTDTHKVDLTARLVSIGMGMLIINFLITIILGKKQTALEHDAK
jgi:Na+/proline symporter